MSEILEETVAVTTVGGDGAAEGEADTRTLHGFLLDIYLDYAATAPATTDVTISYTRRGGNVLAVSDNNTDGLYVPRVKPVDNAGAAITDAHDRFPLNGPLTVAVAGANALTGCVTATIRYMTP